MQTASRPEESKERPMVGDGLPSSTPAGNKGEKQPSLLDQVARKKSLFSQCLINLTIIILATGSGMPIGFSAILLPQLQAPDSSMPTDDDWASWIASVHSVMTPVGAVLSGHFMDCWGRRTMLKLSVLPMVTGWLFICTAPSHIWLAVGRMFAGFAVGMGTGPCQVLIGEVSEPQLRGVFSSSPSLAYSLGILLVYALGSVFHWRVVAALSTVLPIAGLLLLTTLHESPVWLVNQGDVEKARKSLMWLRGGDVIKVNQELHMLVVHHKAQQDRQSAEALREETTCSILPQQFSCLNRPEVLKPFFIILTFCLLQILSGSYIVIFYAVNLISSASGSKETDLNSLTVAVMSALVRFIMSIVTAISLYRLGRRKIGIISGIGTALACFLLVAYLELKNRLVLQLDDSFNIVIIGSLIMIYVALNAFGIFGLPCLMMGEVLPSTVRGFISGILIMFINLFVFSTTKLYPYVARVLGPSGIFFCFAIVAMLTTIYLYLFLPETKDRPLTQIEQYFATGKNYLWLTRDKSLMAKDNKLYI